MKGRSVARVCAYAQQHPHGIQWWALFGDRHGRQGLFHFLAAALELVAFFQEAQVCTVVGSVSEESIATKSDDTTTERTLGRSRRVDRCAGMCTLNLSAKHTRCKDVGRRTCFYVGGMAGMRLRCGGLRRDACV